MQHLCPYGRINITITIILKDVTGDGDGDGDGDVEGDVEGDGDGGLKCAKRSSNECMRCL